MHQALYRKWRPQGFDDVCGQEHITSVLRYEIEHGTPSHAYLFCGSRGTGKTTCAKIMAKAVNCLAPQNGSPCGACEACRSIDNGSATDVLEMDAASNNGVENIRDIRDEVVYTPSALKYRVYIVDEVHMLSASAFNALLKTLEEPPSHVIFILATTELQKLPATIVSRCQRFDFRRIAVPVLAARLSHIAAAEGIELLPDAAERIARLAQGGMRDAISLLELCGGTRRAVTVETVNEMMGSGGREQTLSLVRAILESNYDKIFAAVAETVASARDITVFWQDLIAVYRDMLVMKTADRAAAARYLDLTDAEQEALASLCDGISKSTLLAHCRLLEDALFTMQSSNAMGRMVAELTLVRMCDPSLDTSPEGLLRRIERLEDGYASAPRAIPAVTAPEAAPAPTAPATAAAPTVQAAVPAQKAAAPASFAPAAPTSTPATAPAPTGSTRRRMRDFSNCIERVRRRDPMTASFLESVAAFIDDTGRVTVCFTNRMAMTMLEKGKQRDLLRSALGAQLQREIADNALVFELVEESAIKENTDLDDLIASVNT